jgi:hypothetical protein
MTSATTYHDESRLRSWAAWWALSLLVLLGLSLRLITFRGSFWLDELHTAWVVSGEFDQVAHRATIGNQSPVFYWLLWPYARVFGLSEIALRLPSLVASSAALVAVFLLARRWTSSSLGGLCAAAALAVEANSAMFYASEARVYAGVQLLAILQIYVFGEVLRTANLRHRASLIVLSWLLFYLHYTTALLLAAEFIALLLVRRLKVDSPYRWKSISIDAAILILGCLPAWPHVQAIFARRENWALFIPRAGWQEWLDILPHGQALVFVMLAWGVIACVSWRLKVRLRPEGIPSHAVVLALAWLFIPLYLAWQLTERDIARLFFLRYLVYVLPAGGVLVGILAQSLPSRKTAVSFGAASLLLLTGWNLWLSYPVLVGDALVRNEDWRRAITALNERKWHKGEPLFVASGLVEAEALRASDDAALREYCLFPLHAAYPFQANGIREESLPFRSPGRLSKRHRLLVVTWLTQRDSALFLVRGSEEHARQTAADVEQSLQGEVLCGQFQSFGDLWLFVARRPS